MDEINFDENYNNKLDCTYYTTIRKKSKKYTIGNVYQVNLKNEPLNKYEIHSRALRDKLNEQKYNKKDIKK